MIVKKPPGATSQAQHRTSLLIACPRGLIAVRLAEVLQTEKLYRSLRRREEPLVKIKSTPSLAIYGAKLRRGHFGFEIQLARSPKTLKRRVFRNAASQFILIFKCNRPGGWVRSRTVSHCTSFGRIERSHRPRAIPPHIAGNTTVRAPSRSE